MRAKKNEAPDLTPAQVADVANTQQTCPVETALAMAAEAMPVLDGHGQPVAFPHSDFPERIERPFLPVQVPVEEQAKLGMELNEKLKEKTRLEAAKKSAADRYKGELAVVQEKIEELQMSMDTQTRQMPVESRWVYETNGVDPNTGDFKRDPEFKTLVRLDNYEIVRIEPITEQERQMSLPLAPTEGEAAPELELVEEETDKAAA